MSDQNPPAANLKTMADERMARIVASARFELSSQHLRGGKQQKPLTEQRVELA